MTDQHDWAFDGSRQRCYVLSIAGNAAKRIGCCYDRIAALVQLGDNAVPAGRICKCTVNQDDGRLRFDSACTGGGEGKGTDCKDALNWLEHSALGIDERRR